MKSNETSAALTQQQAQSLAVVQSYFDASISGDLATIENLFTDDVVEIAPFSVTGGPEPSATFTGKDEVMGYQQMIKQNFAQIRFNEPDYTVSADGNRVFFEAHGDFLGRAGSKPYHNIYIFKFILRDGKVARIVEYANPVTFAKLMGMPVG